MQQYRHRHVVGQVGDNRRRRLGRRVDSQRVSVDYGQSIGARRQSRGNRARQLRSQTIIDLNRDHSTGCLQQAEGQRAEARADLQHNVVPGNA